MDLVLPNDTNYSLFVAAYATSTWNGFLAAKNCFDKFQSETKNVYTWPIPVLGIKQFINWAILEKKMSANTVKVFVSNLATLHKLKNMSVEGCKNFAIKTMIRGAENLEFYEPPSSNQRNVMTLPLLRIFGHELSKSDWSTHSISVIWTAACTAFFGSFRFSELLSKNEQKFNPHETLLWKDIVFLEDNSAKIFNKIPKTRKTGGETISLFKFDHFNCCPIAALKKLKKISKANEDSPVFKFKNNSFLTNEQIQ